MQKDNGQYQKKVSIRRLALAKLREIIPDTEPVMMETHGGEGKLYQACYSDVTTGIVFERDSALAESLSRQRPMWAVYEADCITALQAGVGRHLEVNFLDLDPYGDPWPVLDAFLQSDRPFPDNLMLVVNDGLRQATKMKQGWHCPSLQTMVEKYGNELYGRYLQIARELVETKAGQVGHHLTRWVGYYASNDMTHYAALLSKTGSSN